MTVCSSGGGACCRNGVFKTFFDWSYEDKNILQITTGMNHDNTLGYHFPTVNLDTDHKLSVYMPKSDDWEYKVAKDYM